nr:sugar phosphate isomerase/epimerase [Hymenobacter psoromatis]
MQPAEFVARVQAAGYDGVEMVVSPNPAERARWQRLLADHHLLFIGQVLEAGRGKGFTEHLAETELYLRNATTMQPLKINSFTGRDYFSFEQNSALIRRTTEVGQALGVPVVHEIHRGRFTYSAPALLPYLAAFPDLRLNADFSHWCCVSESYLQAPELAHCVRQALGRADHLHARVGHPQGPQVSDPRAPEWDEALGIHLAWWDELVARHRAQGTACFTITPEFGPAPYLPALPHTQQPVADQWELNAWMLALLKSRYAPETAVPLPAEIVKKAESAPLAFP